MNQEAMILLRTIIYIGVLAAVFALGILGARGLGSAPSDGTVVLIHGHVNEQLYEVTVPAGLVELFRGEAGHFHCSPPSPPTEDTGGLCHIEPLP